MSTQRHRTSKLASLALLLLYASTSVLASSRFMESTPSKHRVLAAKRKIEGEVASNNDGNVSYPLQDRDNTSPTIGMTKRSVMAYAPPLNIQDETGLNIIRPVPEYFPDGYLNPRHLFPCHFKVGWTTYPYVPPPLHPSITYITLADSNIGITKVTSGVTHNIVSTSNAYPEVKAYEAVYPQGSINPSGAIRGGFGMYMAGPGGNFDFTTANEIMISYSVFFQEDFDFNIGGKLPGPYGGSTADIAYGCSGGRQEDRDKCFSLRLMWRAGGKGEIYSYLPMTAANNQTLLAVGPSSTYNSDYGISIGTGSFTFTPGKWGTVAMRVKMNDLGSQNGEIQLWFNGKSVINISDVMIRQDSTASVVRGAHFQTFFGGSSAEWASPKNQTAHFAGMSGAIIS